MKKGDIIYKRFHKNKVINVSEMNDIQWFSLSTDYGKESYGPIIHTYIFKEKPQLLDIGKIKNRQNIENIILKYEPEFKKISNPDYQYSGGKSNYKYHSYVKKYFGKDYDGTFIIESDVDSEDLEGPTEIVLWKNFSNLIKMV
jgi:hypothetical protein